MAIVLVDESCHEAGMAARGNADSMQIGKVTVSGNREQLQHLRCTMANYVHDAVARQGARALDNPRSSAVVHEAGHAVMYASFGLRLLYCKIEPDSRDPNQWGGYTQSRGGKWRSDPTSSPEEDFRQACFHLAGVTAEMLFDPINYREASSADEIALAIPLAIAVGCKLNSEPEIVMAHILRKVRGALQENGPAVSEIARALDQHLIVRERRLSKLLANVKRTTVEDLRASLQSHSSAAGQAH